VSMLGMTSVFFTYPLELIRVRMAFQTQSQTAPSVSSYSSFTHVVQQIYREGHSSAIVTSDTSSRAPIDRLPILKFYRGFTVTVAGMVPYAGVSFLSWGFLRAQLLPAPGHGRPKATPLADLCIGAVSGAVGQTVSYPFEVVRRRMQVGGITQPDRWLRWGETACSIWRTGGWRGFYVGLGIGLLKMVPMTSVSFSVWQGMKRVLDV
jgi:solute carrier family 25 protein 16